MSLVDRRWRYPLSAGMSDAGALRTPLLGTATRSTGRALLTRAGGSQVSVDVVQGESPRQHEHLHPIEELADLLRRPLVRLVLGGHPGLRRLLDHLLAGGVHPVADG